MAGHAGLCRAEFQCSVPFLLFSSSPCWGKRLREWVVDVPEIALLVTLVGLTLSVPSSVPCGERRVAYGIVCATPMWDWPGKGLRTYIFMQSENSGNRLRSTLPRLMCPFIHACIPFNEQILWLSLLRALC